MKNARRPHSKYVGPAHVAKSIENTADQPLFENFEPVTSRKGNRVMYPHGKPTCNENAYNSTVKSFGRNGMHRYGCLRKASICKQKGPRRGYSYLATPRTTPRMVESKTKMCRSGLQIQLIAEAGMLQIKKCDAPARMAVRSCDRVAKEVMHMRLMGPSKPTHMHVSCILIGRDSKHACVQRSVYFQICSIFNDI